ncbi:hypothetical protein AX14_006275 [Amanita brunnescens Koide BX004]|nr:hypothetical protein AX14_006275 [Amanita brunnescens Koide BX004]
MVVLRVNAISEASGVCFARRLLACLPFVLWPVRSSSCSTINHEARQLSLLIPVHWTLSWLLNLFCSDHGGWNMWFPETGFVQVGQYIPESTNEARSPISNLL